MRLLARPLIAGIAAFGGNKKKGDEVLRTAGSQLSAALTFVRPAGDEKTEKTEQKRGATAGVSAALTHIKTHGLQHPQA